jgi:hypothetical protein
MNTPNIEILSSFDVTSLPNLDTVVLGALELFQKEKPVVIPLDTYKHPLVVGSGNAEATGRIIFEQKDAIFASESNYEAKLENIEAIDGVVLISASGGKHAPSIARRAKDLGKDVTLITDRAGSEAHKILDEASHDKEYLFHANREPYTYNTSSYMGMILGATGENPSYIYQFIREQVDQVDFSSFGSYDKYYLIVPAQYSLIVSMLQVKFIELFGRNIAVTVATSEYVKHATTVVPAHELFISFREDNTLWGNVGNRITIPLPEHTSYGAMMAIGYYVIGKIQGSHQPFFKEHIESYTQAISKVFGEEITPIIG